MREDGPEISKRLEPLEWRNVLPQALVIAFDNVQTDELGQPDAEKYKDVSMTLDRIAREAAHRGVDVEARAGERKEALEAQHQAGRLTEGQLEFMRDETDAILQLINWAHETKLIDEDMRSHLREAIN